MSETLVTEPRHIVLSGGSRGLGKTLTEALLTAGYRVSTFSRKPTDYTDRQAQNPNFLFQAADISNPQSIAQFMEAAERKFGCPYGLVNCAGIALDGVLAMMPDAAFEQLLTVNLLGTLRLTRLVIRKMLVKSSPGAIVNISSIIGLRGYSGLAAYAATKGGMDSMTRALARELGGRKIRVNSVAPGYLKTEMTHGLSPEQTEQIVRRTPMGRLGAPEDVVGAVLFLMSDAASFITGQVLVVDGGVTA